MRAARRLTLLVALAWLTAAIMPGSALSASSPQPAAAAALPDRWSGSWPSQLMPDAVPLGTLSWRPIRYEEGMGQVGHLFGGLPFEGCPADGVTRFFRGRYDAGGTLIACTRGEQADVLVGRFDGNEQLRSGSFHVRIVRTDPAPLFFGEYVEDDGLVTDWCGVLETPFLPALLPERPSSPSVTVLASARAGQAAMLRFSVYGGDGRVRVQLVVVRKGRVVHRAAVAVARTDGSPLSLRWKAPAALSGSFSVCALGRDAAGRASPRSCAPLRL